MINRILIRVKVIQILYSFLLMEKNFSLESVAENPTKEKRYAHSLYMDLLVLMIKISESITQRGGYQPLAETKFIKRLKTEDAVASLLAKYRMNLFPFEGMVERLTEKVKESGIYKNYLKDIKEGKADEYASLWSDIYNILIYPDEVLSGVISRTPGYTISGAERARELINTTFRNFMTSGDNNKEAEKMLQQSFDKSQELYYRLLWLPVELTNIQERKLDDRRYRHIVSEEDRNPNMKFVENSFIKALKECEPLTKYVEKNKISWYDENPVMLENLLKCVLESEIYKTYMTSGEHSRKEDAEFWREVLKKLVYNNLFFLEEMEDQSVFWNDDLEIIGTFVLKSIRKYIEDESESFAVIGQFKDKEDERFGRELVNYVLKNRDEYRSMIDNVIDKSQWESERLAFMDVVVMETALAEILNFPGIPLSASLNEYIEIAKSYSTLKSGGFVNGILGKIIKELQNENKLIKR